jgi:hypothetical protein
MKMFDSDHHLAMTDYKRILKSNSFTCLIFVLKIRRVLIAEIIECSLKVKISDEFDITNPAETPSHGWSHC